MSHHHNKNQSEWINKCRNVLIDMETKNIRQRALSWTEIVNAETLRVNSMLNINLNRYGVNGDNLLYSYTVNDPLKYLTFLSEWSGIKTRNTSTQPTNYIEFESKAKNWLNGRRAPNYGNTLFPDMIKTAYKYSNKLSKLIFGNIPINTLSNSPTSDSLINQYHKTLLFAYLNKLCSERIAVHQSWKKTNLLCENSVKNIHSNTAKLLQNYAIHDYMKNDLNSFPGNLQRAAAFFSEQHNQYLSRLIHSYNTFKSNNNNNNNTNNRSQPPQPLPNMSNNNNNINNNHHHYQQRKNDMNNNSDYNTAHNRNNRNNANNISSVNVGNTVPVNYVAIKSSDWHQLMQRLTDLERKHNAQAEQISTLTKSCQLLQSHIDNNTQSTIVSLPGSGGAVNHYDKLSSNDEYCNDQSILSMDCSIRQPTSSNTNSNNSTQNTNNMSNNGVINITGSPSIHSHQSHQSHHSSHHSSLSCNDNISLNTNKPSHLQLPVMAQRLNTNRSQTQPIPFNMGANNNNNRNNNNNTNTNTNNNNSHSLPPQLHLPSFNTSSSSSTVIINNAPNQTQIDRKFDIQYNCPPNPPQITTLTTSTSMPSITTNPPNIYHLNSNTNTNTNPSTPRSNIGGNIAGGVGGTFNGYNEYGLTFSMYSNPNNNDNESKYNNNNTNDAVMSYMTSSTPNNGTNLSLLNNGSYLSSDHTMFDHNESTPNNTNNMFAFSPMEYNHNI